MLHQLPLVRRDVVVDVDAGEVVVEVDVEPKAVVRPRAKLEVARLDVVRKVGDVDGAGALEDRLRDPEHGTVVRDDDHRLAVLVQTRVGAVPCADMVGSFS